MQRHAYRWNRALLRKKMLFGKAKIPFQVLTVTEASETALFQVLNRKTSSLQGFPGFNKSVRALRREQYIFR